MSDPSPPMHPVQATKHSWGRIAQTVSLRAYEVPRGGTGELIAFLYAYPFPKTEWSARIDEAFRGMEGL